MADDFDGLFDDTEKQVNTNLVTKAEQRVAKADEKSAKLDAKMRKLIQQRKEAKLEQENAHLHEEVAKLRAISKKAQQVVGIAEAALDVFGKELPHDRERASQMMRQMLNNKSVHNN